MEHLQRRTSLKIEKSLEAQERFMEGIGVVINWDKSELIIFNGDKKGMKLSNGITSVTCIKALRVLMDDKLS